SSKGEVPLPLLQYTLSPQDQRAMRLWDFFFPHRHEGADERGQRRGTKETSKKRKEKKNEPKPAKSTSAESSSARTKSSNSVDMSKSSLPKTDVLEECSAQAASSDPGSTDC
ncbi:hypothetical protein PMAYCL1PPCAC_28518, partial [Pristionchus mayeri]